MRKIVELTVKKCFKYAVPYIPEDYYLFNYKHCFLNLGNLIYLRLPLANSFDFIDQLCVISVELGFIECMVLEMK